jgi:glycosyltransferase involved in cell wall biosynthesis
VLEAMARDVVVVGSDIPPLREILGAEQVCASEEQAIELLRAILGDHALRERLLASQRERRAAYGTGRMVVEWRALYQLLAAGRGGGQMSELAASHSQEGP